MVSIIEHSQSNSSLHSPITKYPVLDFANKSETSFQFPIPMKPKLGFQVLVSVFCSIPESKCSKGCGLALASYYEWQGSNLTIIAEVLQSDLNIIPDTIVSYNKQKIPSKDTVCSTGYKNQCLYLLVRAGLQFLLSSCLNLRTCPKA